jgi:phosphonate transport system substrate-binding protein
MRLLAVPVFQGRPLYQAYLIVPAGDRETASLEDLRGRSFAYSDPDSNSGYLYVQYLLAGMRQDPAAFFSRTFFTWAHRKVVEAVGARLAQGGSVDGYVWETLARFEPELTARTRVVSRSPEFGHPPLVARNGLADADFAPMRAALLEMAGDPAGARVLDRLNLDGFVAGDDELFRGIALMVETVFRRNDDAAAA